MNRNSSRVVLLVLPLLLGSCGEAGPLTTGPDEEKPPITGTPNTPGTPTSPSDASVWDLDAKGLPKLVTADYIELGRVQRISLFRSAQGHDYSDDVEKCRSMKHYFVPRDLSSSPTVKIFAPFSGEVVRVVEEWAGSQVQIRSDSIGAFTAILFHVKLDQPLQVGTKLKAGAQIGTHIGSMTYSDIAVEVRTPTKRRFVSYVQMLNDAVWSGYAAKGLTRDALVLTKEQRDADPLTCNGETFTSTGSLKQWVDIPG